GFRRPRRLPRLHEYGHAHRRSEAARHGAHPRNRRYLIDELRADFQSRIIHSSEGSVTFRFDLPTEHDERARLRATSTADILRTLQFSQLYSGESLPFLGGGFAFDYVATFEELPPVPDGPNAYPDYEFLVAEHVLTVDHLTKRAKIEGWGVDKRALEAELDRTAATEPITPEAPAPCETISARASIDDAAFRRHVERLQGNVHAGDIYQVVPSRAFSLDCPDAFAAYRTLRKTNPSPYMFYLRGEEHELFGASPESNLKYTASDRQVQLYPVAGTRPRGATHELDIRNELEMRTDSKEVSEHIMLVDLARNDLARVAVPGTRKVADLLQVDRYSRVMHLVSRVIATLH
ncbi:chorismate-binding protein, partial [Corynebacterium hesseae]|uniref:chorismate-binding protein n=1 Tax=Corynebacterium hesseae TaxID=2913502 RepID=UPI00373EB9D0